MKKIIFITLSILTVTIIFGQNDKFPVNNTPVSSEFDFWRFVEAEGAAISYSSATFASTSSGQDVPTYTSGTGGQVLWRNWKSTTPISITPNTLVGMVTTFSPTPGFRYIIKRITITITNGASITLNKAPCVFSGGQPMVDGRTTFNSDNSFNFITNRAGTVDTSSRYYDFDYTKTPLILPYGAQLGIGYYLNSTISPQWLINIEGYKVANDENYAAPNKLLLIGESTGTTSENWCNQDSICQYMLLNQMREDHYDFHLSNICIGGTSSIEWEFMLRNDWRLQYNVTQNCKHLVCYIFLGINDRVQSNFCPSAGTDGIFKTTLKKLIQYVYDTRLCKGDTADIILGIGTCQTTTINYTGANSAYYGMTLQSIAQSEELAVISDLNAAGITSLVASRTDQAWNTSQASNYTIEGTHPSNGVAHPTTSGNGWEYRVGIYPAYQTVKSLRHFSK